MNILEELLEHKEYFVNNKILGVMLLNFSRNRVNISRVNNSLYTNETSYKLRLSEECVNICDEDGQIRFFICESRKREFEFYERGDIIEGPYNLMRADLIY